jgi:hypothetical protein
MSPPFLVIRPGQAFWVEAHAPQDATATPGAFADGCYDGTWWYDATGGVWTVVEATLKVPPSLLERGLQRPVAVDLRFGSRAEADLPEALARLRDVLTSDNGFCDALKMPAARMQAEFERARATSELASIASRFE